MNELFSSTGFGSKVLCVNFHHCIISHLTQLFSLRLDFPVGLVNEEDHLDRRYQNPFCGRDDIHQQVFLANFLENATLRGGGGGGRFNFLV